jgi:hypothetical protein
MITTIAVYSPRLETFPLISSMAANSPAIIQPIPTGENLYFKMKKQIALRILRD